MGIQIYIASYQNYEDHHLIGAFRTLEQAQDNCENECDPKNKWVWYESVGNWERVAKDGVGAIVIEPTELWED